MKILIITKNESEAKPMYLELAKQIYAESKDSLSKDLEVKAIPLSLAITEHNHSVIFKGLGMTDDLYDIVLVEHDVILFASSNICNVTLNQNFSKRLNLTKTGLLSTDNFIKIDKKRGLYESIKELFMTSKTKTVVFGDAAVITSFTSRSRGYDSVIQEVSLLDARCEVLVNITKNNGHKLSVEFDKSTTRSLFLSTEEEIVCNAMTPLIASYEDEMNNEVHLPVGVPLPIISKIGNGKYFSNIIPSELNNILISKLLS